MPAYWEAKVTTADGLKETWEVIADLPRHVGQPVFDPESEAWYRVTDLGAGSGRYKATVALEWSGKEPPPPKLQAS